MRRTRAQQELQDRRWGERSPYHDRS
jgi:hypothetical protein